MVDDSRAGFDAPMNDFIAVVARRAGAELRRYFRSATLRHDDKGAWDLVTEADHAAESLIIGAIRERFPDHDVLGEESGRSGAAARWLWLIDPLDGTLNYSRGLTTWGVSIALAEDGEVRYGAFYDPLQDELFYAERGKGARLDGRPLRTSGATRLADALVYTSLPHGPGQEARLRNVERLSPVVMRLRMSGSVGAALAGIAAGRMDAAIEAGGGAWDYAAGGLLVREAGGHTSTVDGQPSLAETTTMLAAATPTLHDALWGVIGRYSVSEKESDEAAGARAAI